MVVWNLILQGVQVGVSRINMLGKEGWGVKGRRCLGGERRRGGLKVIGELHRWASIVLGRWRLEHSITQMSRIIGHRGWWGLLHMLAEEAKDGVQE